MPAIPSELAHAPESGAEAEAGVEAPTLKLTGRLSSR
jgi:hypothetical protein